MENKKNICIIGNGAWGRALHHVIKQNVPEVRMVTRGEMITDGIVVLSVPTQSIRDLAPFFTSNSHPLIINTAKGIERETHLLPEDILKEILPGCEYLSLIGPSFAGEVIRSMPTIVNLGYEKKTPTLDEVLHLLQTDFFRVRLSKGIAVLELSGALKNIYAIGCGLADGMGYETNTRIQLIVLAIEEVQRLFKRMKLIVDSGKVAGTIGDLVLTCNSLESRNFQFGRNLSTLSTEESLKKVHATVEGYSTLDSLEFLEKKAGVTLPFASFIKDVVEADNPKLVKRMFEKFIKST